MNPAVFGSVGYRLFLEGFWCLFSKKHMQYNQSWVDNPGSISPHIFWIGCEAFSLAMLSFIGTAPPPGVLVLDQSDTCYARFIACAMKQYIKLLDRPHLLLGVVYPIQIPPLFFTPSPLYTPLEYSVHTGAYNIPHWSITSIPHIYVPHWSIIIYPLTEYIVSTSTFVNTQWSIHTLSYIYIANDFT